MSKTIQFFLKKALHFFKWLLFGVLILFLVLVLFIRSAWGQDIIKSQLSDFVTNKIETEVSIKKLYLSFSGNLIIEELYVEDQQKDTLLYSDELEVSLAILPIITQNTINVKKIDWQGLNVNVEKLEENNQYNFDYIINTFVDPNAPKEPETTTSEPLNIKIGTVHFSNFDISFYDEVLGVDAKLNLGDLELSIGNQLDINTYHFPVEELFLSNVDVSYIQSKSFPETEETQEASPQPIIEIGDLSLHQIKMNYEDKTSNSLANISLADFNINDANIDLKTQKIDIEEIGLKNTTAQLAFISDTKAEQTTEKKTDSSFVWPDWDVKLDKFVFKENNFALKTGNTKTPKNVLNPENIALNKATILLNDLELTKNNLTFDFNEISFEEKSGFQLKELALRAQVTDEQIDLTKFNVVTKHSKLNSKATLKYSSINSFMNQPKNATFNLELSDVDINVKDAFYFNDSLQQNEYIGKLSKNTITGEFKSKGSLKNIDISNLNLQWGNKTRVSLSGEINDVLSENNLSFNLPNIRFKTDKESVKTFVNEEDLGISIPNTINLKSDTKGSLSKIETNTLLQLDKGEISLVGNFKNQIKSVVNGNLKVTDIDLGKIINNPKIGLLAFETNVDANWKDLDDLNADLETKFSSLIFEDYNYKPLEIKGNIEQGKGVVTTNFKDNNLDFDTKTKINLDSLTSQIKSSIRIKGVNLQALKITEKNLKARINIDVDYKTNNKGLAVNAKTENGLLVYNEESFPVSNFIISTNIAKDSTTASVESDLVNFKLNANANPTQISKAINDHISSYFTKNKLDSIGENTQLNAEFSIRQNPILDQIFLEGLNEFEPINFKVDFAESEKKLNADFSIPFVEYQGSKVQNGKLSLNTAKDDFNLDFKVANVLYNPINIQNINLQGKVVNGVVMLDFSTSDETEKIININSEVTANDTLVKVHISPKNIILNRKNWQILADNALLFNGNFKTKDFKLTRNEQAFSLTADVEEELNNLDIDFKNFELLNVLAFLNPEQNIASGTMQGNVKINGLNKEQNIVSDLSIEQLKVLENLLGTLQIKATTNNNKNYDVKLSLQEQDKIDLKVKGSYDTEEDESPLNLNVALNKLALTKLEAFAQEYISNASGNLSANFKMKGKIEAPVYNGSLNFNDAQLKVNSFNTDFTFPEESIAIDNSKILLNKFTILDKDKNEFMLDGEVLTIDFSNPEFNLSLTSENLQVLNSTEKDNDLYYGKLFLDADVKIGGDLNIPKVTGNIKVNKNSDVTYVVPESEIEAVEREGVVVFVNKKVTNDILTQTDNTKANRGIVTGLNIKTILKVDPSAVLNVVIDKKTGDNLQLSGEADLNFAMTPNGNTNLSGKYEVSSGHYEASLYNLVTRKFDIAKGSSVLWQGDPLEAKMDIKAIYKTKASASGLMSSVTSGMDAETLNQYRKKLPFWVYLNLEGELLKPEISFNLDIPEDSRGELGGGVYTQVQQLNNSEEDLNKQVFSLLVLNQFFPSSSSDGSSGGSLSIARDNVNKALSNQLNTYSNKLVGNTGVELGFDIDSYTDYTDEGEQNNTELNVSAKKRLFNDRLTVQVGSGFELENTSKSEDDKTPIIGNVNIEYALTEDRRYKLKGFRKNEYESVIDGQVIVTGISILFNREFNKFRELWFKANKEKSDEE